MRLPVRLVVAAFALTGSMSACTAMAPAADAPGLDGTAWVLSASRPHAGGRHDDHAAIRRGSCQRHGRLQSLLRPYSVKAGTLDFGPVALRPDGLSAGSDATGRRVHSRLGAARSYRVEADSCSCSGPTANLLAALVPQRRA